MCMHISKYMYVYVMYVYVRMYVCARMYVYIYLECCMYEGFAVCEFGWCTIRIVFVCLHGMEFCI